MDKKEFLDILNKNMDEGNFNDWINEVVCMRLIDTLHSQGKTYEAGCLNELVEAYINNDWYRDHIEVNGHHKYISDFLIENCPKNDDTFRITEFPFDFFINNVSIFDEQFENEIKKELDKC